MKRSRMTKKKSGNDNIRERDIEKERATREEREWDRKLMNWEREREKRDQMQKRRTKIEI